MNKRLLIRLLLAGAVLTAIFTRFWKISSLPFPPEGDELAFGYYGWSLLHYHTDEYNNFLPVNFQSIGDYKYPGLPYLNIIPALIFGLDPITVRFWNAIFSILLVLVVYKIANFIFKNELTAIISAWLIALSPWSIIESRLGWENHISMVLTLIGLLLLITNNKVIKKSSINPIFKGQNIIFLFSFLILLTASFVYAAERIFIPLVLAWLWLLTFIENSEISKIRKVIFYMFLGFIIVIGSTLSVKNNRGRASEDSWRGLNSKELDRLQQVYVASGTSEIKLPARITWAFHNKYRVAITDFFERYGGHFSPNYLFFKGEENKQKIPDMGVLLYIELLLLPIGFMTLLPKMGKINDNNNTKILILLGWLILAPLASALTIGEAKMNRASLMIPAIALISANGFTNITNIFSKKIKPLAIFVLSIGIITSSAYSLSQIFVVKPQDRPWYKEQVYGEIAKDILSMRTKHKQIVVSDDDYIYFLFYGNISPKEFLENSEIIPTDLHSNWERVNRLYNITFKMPFNCPRSGKLDVVYLCSGVEVPQNADIIKTYYFLDGVPAYNLVKFYPISNLTTKHVELPKNVHYMVELEKNPAFSDGIIPNDFPSYW